MLLAAGCSSSKPAAENNAVMQNKQVVEKNSNGEPVAASVEAKKVNGTDDAANLLEANSSSEQKIVIGTDDSDLTSSDTAELNSLTEVPDAQ